MALREDGMEEVDVIVVVREVEAAKEGYKLG